MKKKGNNKQNEFEEDSEEGILSGLLHRVTGKIQLINQECGLRNEEYEKMIAYMGQAIMSIEVIEVTTEMRKNQSVVSAKENSLVQDSEIQDLLFIKLTKRFETYMTEIQKKILSFEGYEKTIRSSVAQIGDFLAEIEQLQIITGLLSLEVEDKSDEQEDKQSEEKKKERVMMYENVKKEIKKLAKIDSDYSRKLEIARDIKSNFTPFSSTDSNLSYWKKRIGLEV